MKNMNFDLGKKIKRFLLRMNRGLVLGLVLILIMAIYVATTNAIFNKETKPALRSLSRSFVTDMLKSGEPMKQMALGEPLTAAVKQAVRNEYLKTFDKYFDTNPQNKKAGGFRTNVEGLEKWLERADSCRILNVTMVTYSYLSEDEQIHVTKLGNDQARVEFQKVSVRVQFVGAHWEDFAYFSPSSKWSLEDVMISQDKNTNEGDKTENPTETKDLYTFTVNISIGGTLFFEKQGKEWKIISTRNLYMHTPQVAEKEPYQEKQS